MDIQQLLEYDAWATARLLRAVEKLSPEQFTRELAGSQSSVRQQFAHLLSVIDRYRARLAGEPAPELALEAIAAS